MTDYLNPAACGRCLYRDHCPYTQCPHFAMRSDTLRARVAELELRLAEADVQLVDASATIGREQIANAKLRGRVAELEALWKTARDTIATQNLIIGSVEPGRFEELRKILENRAIQRSAELARELRDFHDHAIDQGWHDCDGIPGGCPVLAALAKATAPAQNEREEGQVSDERYVVVSIDEAHARGWHGQDCRCGKGCGDFGFELYEVSEDGRAEFIGCDGGEPEDQLLCRDWDWVAPALEQARKKGEESLRARVAELEAERGGLVGALGACHTALIVADEYCAERLQADARSREILATAVRLSGAALSKVKE